MKRSFGGVLALLFCVSILGGCAAKKSEDAPVQPVEAGDYSVTYKESDTDATVEATVRYITLAGDTVTFDGTDSLASVNGSTTGSATDGLVSGGTFTPGELSTDVTLDGVSTALNMGGAPGGFGGGGRMDEPPGGKGGQMGEPPDGRGGQMGEPPDGFGGVDGLNEQGTQLSTVCLVFNSLF